MLPRDPNIEAKPEAKKWLDENERAGAIFTVVKELLLNLYRGENHGYINAIQVVQYRFNSWNEHGVIVTGRKTFTRIEVSDKKTQRPIPFEIYPESMESDLEKFLAFFREFGNPTFSLENPVSFEEEGKDDFFCKVEVARKLASDQRKKILDADSGIPQIQIRQVAFYVRNPYVVAERLQIAGGRCEKCGNNAPFIRKGNGAPYLEVHHIIQLSKGGLDKIENTEALCPNCHRQRHYGY